MRKGDFVEKKRVKNMLDLPDSKLRNMYSDEPIEGVEVCERVMQNMSHGFHVERFVFKMPDKRYYKFVAISYLDDQLVFTKPFEVFKTEEEVTRTNYSPWIDAEEDEE